MIKYISLISIVLGSCAAAPSPVPSPISQEPSTAQSAAPATSVQENSRTAEAASAPQAQMPALSQKLLSQKQRFANWKTKFMAEAIAKGYTPELVKSTIGKAKINPKAIKKFNNQPEFSRPIWSYVDGVRSAKRLNEGKEKLALHTQLYDNLESSYGVNREILTAIWGLESAYGKILGDHDMIDSLSTLAFEGRRAKFGESQLYGILDLLVSGQVRKDQLTGSWAGAMGMTQFIPTTFRDYAVDYDNDGNKDLWKNEGDALGSAASYLKRFGWRPAEPILAEVKLPSNFDYSLSGGTKRTIAGWAALGVQPLSGKNWSTAAMFLETKLLVPAGTKGPIFLSFKNFDVIKKYNNSTAYAMGITVLAESFEGKTTITKDWPRDDKPISFTDKKNMQRALVRQGYDTGGIDGHIGPKSRTAIRAWQAVNGVPVDGYVEQTLLQKILTK